MQHFIAMLTDDMLVGMQVGAFLTLVGACLCLWLRERHLVRASTLQQSVMLIDGKIYRIERIGHQSTCQKDAHESSLTQENGTQYFASRRLSWNLPL